MMQCDVMVMSRYLLCPAMTTLYYKVLLQYDSVLQRIAPVLPCTTKTAPVLLCTTKVLLHYYSVLESTTPVLQSTTLTLYSSIYSVLQSTTVYYSNTPLYDKVALLIDP